MKIIRSRSLETETVPKIEQSQGRGDNEQQLDEIKLCNSISTSNKCILMPSMENHYIMEDVNSCT